jgi:hypothetical protein
MRQHIPQIHTCLGVLFAIPIGPPMSLCKDYQRPPNADAIDPHLADSELTTQRCQQSQQDQRKEEPTMYKQTMMETQSASLSPSSASLASLSPSSASLASLSPDPAFTFLSVSGPRFLFFAVSGPRFAGRSLSRASVLFFPISSCERRKADAATRLCGPGCRAPQGDCTPRWTDRAQERQRPSLQPRRSQPRGQKGWRDDQRRP